jgi:hypothetical protein
MRRNPASSASRIARLFSTSGSMTTRVARGSASSCQVVTVRSRSNGQYPRAVFGWTHQRMQAGVVLAGGVVLGERVKIGAGELAVAHRDAVQLAQVRGGMRAAVLSAQVGRDLDPGTTASSKKRTPPRVGQTGVSSPRHPRETCNLAEANVICWTCDWYRRRGHHPSQG